ncbi:hypothetical protein CEXT_732541 [Caerostris extrusa]|uniref:Uncharacterized protein n=1 Tax=Caerostris extrusa TaxID=172846 RepID=A0AAV4QZC2_CAEEX|nr:hypothetical protein CEXT_732541 [Caerostris extrusa]
MKMHKINVLFEIYRMSLWTSYNTISSYPSMNSPCGVGISTKGKEEAEVACLLFKWTAVFIPRNSPDLDFRRGFSEVGTAKAPPMSHIMLLMGRDLCGGKKIRDK